MRKRSESTEIIKRDFDKDRAAGLSHPEIAKKHNVSTTHYYKILGEIAEERGVTKKDLLDRKQKLHAAFERTPREVLRAMSSDEFNKHCDAAIAEIDEMLTSIKKFIAEEPDVFVGKEQ